VPSTVDLCCSHLPRELPMMLCTIRLKLHRYDLLWICCKLGCIICRQQIDQVEFQPHRAPIAVGLQSNMLAITTSACCLVITLCVQRDKVFLREAASRGSSALADLLVCYLKDSCNTAGKKRMLAAPDRQCKMMI